jgi:hypothetical protein
MMLILLLIAMSRTMMTTKAFIREGVIKAVIPEMFRTRKIKCIVTDNLDSQHEHSQRNVLLAVHMMMNPAMKTNIGHVMVLRIVAKRMMRMTPTSDITIAKSTANNHDLVLATANLQGDAIPAVRMMTMCHLIKMSEAIHRAAWFAEEVPVSKTTPWKGDRACAQVTGRLKIMVDDQMRNLLIVKPRNQSSCPCP